MNIKTLTIVTLAFTLMACSSVPPPPHCEDNGKGLQPINPGMMTQEQIKAVRAEHQKPEHFDTRGGSRK